MSSYGSSPVDALIHSRESQSTVAKATAATEAEVTRRLTPDDLLNFIGFGRFQVLAFLLAGLTYITYGFDVSVFIFVGTSVEDVWGLSNLAYAGALGATAIPNVIGVAISSFLADRIGRVWPYTLSLAICGVFGLASAFAPNFPVFIALRCLTSVGVGGVGVLTYPCLIEVLPVRNRGKMSVLVVLLPAIGLCIASGTAWFLLTHYHSYGWRYYIIATAIPSLFMVFYRLVFYYDSPRFLIVGGKLRKSWKVFSVMAKINGLKLTEFITEEDFYATFSTEARGSKKSTSVTLFFSIFKPHYLRRTLCVTVLVITESFGYLGSTLFLPEYLHKLGQDLYFSIFVAFVAQIPGILFMSIIVEWPRVGRLNSMRLFSALSVVFFLLFGFIQTPVTISVFLVFLYFCMIPILSLIYTYISESYPTSIRAQATAYFFALQLLLSIIYPFVSGLIVGFDISWLYPAVWAGVFLVQFVAALVLNYEPYGKYLEDVVE